VLITHGIDTTVAGVRGVARRETQRTVTAQEVTGLTGSETAGTVVDAAIPLGTGVAAAGARIAANRAAASAAGELAEVATAAESVAPKAGAVKPFGARGPASGRDFDPNLAGGPVRRLTTDLIKVTNQGINVVEQHVGRFGPDPANQGMIQRLRDIAAGNLQPTQTDLNFYSRELREFVRYRQLGWRTGQPNGANAAYDLWNNAHTAAMEDYLLREGPTALYDPSVMP